VTEDADYLRRVEHIIRMVDEMNNTLNNYIAQYTQLQGELLLLDSNNESVEQATRLSEQLAQTENDFKLLLSIKNRIEAYRSRMGLG
jgi:GTP-binding protein EngB required for normal cell division